MVLSNYVASLLTAYLGSFLKDINKDSVNVSILRGYVELRNVELSPAITEGNDFFRLQRGVIGYLKVSIPWHSLNRKSCSITIRDVSILLSTHKHSEEKTHAEQKHRKKLDQLDIESAASSAPVDEDGNQEGGASPSSSTAHGESTGGGGGYFERLQQTIIANFAFIIENVVVRIEETTGCYEGMAAAATLSFDKIFCESTDNEYRPQFITVTPGASIYRHIEYQALTASLFHYVAAATPSSSSSLPNTCSVGDFAQYCRNSENASHFLEPCNAEIRVVQSGGATPGSSPTFHVQYHSAIHETKVSEVNVRAIRALVYAIMGGQRRLLLSERPLTRPSAAVPGSTGEWWEYILNEVRAHVKRRRRKSRFNWNQYLERKQRCNEYFTVCLEGITNTSSPSMLLERKTQLENSLPLVDLLACRRIARAEAKKESQERISALPRDFREIGAPALQKVPHQREQNTETPAFRTLGVNLVASVHWDILRTTAEGGLGAEMNGLYAAISLEADKEPSICVAPKGLSLGLGACKRVFSLKGHTHTEDCITVLHYLHADGGSRTVISGNELSVQINADALGAVLALAAAYQPLIDSLMTTTKQNKARASPSRPASPKEKTTETVSAQFSQRGSPVHVIEFGLQQVAVSLYEVCIIARSLRSSVSADVPPTLSIEDLIITVHGSALAYANDVVFRSGGKKKAESLIFVQTNLRVENNLEGVEYIKETLAAIKQRVSDVFPATEAKLTDADDAVAIPDEKTPFSVEILFPHISFLDLELHMLHVCGTVGSGWCIQMTASGLTTSAADCPEADLELVLWADGYLENSPYDGNIVDDGIAFLFEVNNVQLTLNDSLCTTAEQLLDLAMLAIFKMEDPRVNLRDTDANKIPALCGTVTLSYSTLKLCPCQSAIPTDNPLRTLQIVASDNGDVCVSVKRFRDKEMYVDVTLGDGLDGFLDDSIVPIGLFPLRRGSAVTLNLHIMPPCLEDLSHYPYNRLVLDLVASDKAVVLHLPTVMCLWDHFNTSGAGLWRLRNIGSRIHFSSRVERGRAFPPRSPRSERIVDIGSTARLTAEAPPNPTAPAFGGPYSLPVLPGDLNMSIRFSQCELYYMWGDGSVAPLFLHSNVTWCDIDISNHDCCARVELSGVASLPRVACSTSVSDDGSGNEEPTGQASPVPECSPGKAPHGYIARRRATFAAECDDDEHMFVKLIYTNDSRPPFHTGVSDESMMVSITGCRPRGLDGYVGLPTLRASLTPAELASWVTFFTFYGKDETKEAEAHGSVPQPSPPPHPASNSPPKPRRFLLDLRVAPVELYIPTLGTAVVLWHGVRFTMAPGCNVCALPHLSLLVHRALQAEHDKLVSSASGLPLLRRLADEGYVLLDLYPSPCFFSSPASDAPASRSPGLEWRSGPLSVQAADESCEMGPGKALSVHGIHMQLSEAVLVEMQNTSMLARLDGVSEARKEQESWLMDAIHCRRRALAFAQNNTANGAPSPRPQPNALAAAAAAATKTPGPPPAESTVVSEPSLSFSVARAELSAIWLSYCCERTMAALACVVRDLSYSAEDGIKIGDGRVEISPQKSQVGRQRRRRQGLRGVQSSSSMGAVSPTMTAPSSPRSWSEGAMVPRVLLPRLNVHSTPTNDGVVIVVSPVLVLLTTSTCVLLLELAQRMTRVLRHYKETATDNALHTQRRRRSSTTRFRAATRAAFYGYIPRLVEELALIKLEHREPEKGRNSPDLLTTGAPESPAMGSVAAAHHTQQHTFDNRGTRVGKSTRSESNQKGEEATSPPRVRCAIALGDVELHCISLERAEDEDAFHTHAARLWTRQQQQQHGSSHNRSATSGTPSHHHASSADAKSAWLPNMEETLRTVLAGTPHPSAAITSTALASLFTVSLRGTRVTGFRGAWSVAVSSCTVLHPRNALKMVVINEVELYVPSAPNPRVPPLTQKPPTPAAASSTPTAPPTPPYVGSMQGFCSDGETGLRVESIQLEPRVDVVMLWSALYVETPVRAVAAAAATWHRAFTVPKESNTASWVLLRSAASGEAESAAAGALSEQALSASVVLDPSTTLTSPRMARERGHDGSTLRVEHVVQQTWHVTHDLVLSRQGLVLCFSNVSTNHLVVDLGGYSVTLDPATLRPGRPATERLLMIVDAHMTVSFKNGTFRLPVTAWTTQMREAVAGAEGGGVAAALVPFVALSEGSYITSSESVRITFFADDDLSSSTTSDADGGAEGEEVEERRRVKASLEAPAQGLAKRPTRDAGSEKPLGLAALRAPAAFDVRKDRRRRPTSPVSTRAARASPTTPVVRHFHAYVGTLQLTQHDRRTARSLRASLRVEAWARVCGGKLQRDDVHVKELQIETFASDAPSRAMYTTVLAPTSLTVASSDGAHHALSADALVMDMTREDVMQFAGVARACVDLAQHIQHLSMTDAEKEFARRLHEALAWRRASPAAVAGAWGADDEDDIAAESATEGQSGGDPSANSSGGREGSSVFPDTDNTSDCTPRDRGPAAAAATNSQNNNKQTTATTVSSVALFVPLVEITLSDPRYPLLRARAHGVLVRRVVASPHMSTVHVQNESLGLDVYGKGRWDTVVLPTAAFTWSRTATVARHSSNVHTSLHGDGVQVQLSHLALFKVRFVVAHALLFGKSFSSAFSAVADSSTPRAEEEDDEDDEGDVIARSHMPNSRTANNKNNNNNNSAASTRRSQAQAGEEESDADVALLAAANETEEKEDTQETRRPSASNASSVHAIDVSGGDDEGEEEGEEEEDVQTSPVYHMASSGMSSATHRFHNAYNCALFLLVATATTSASNGTSTSTPSLGLGLPTDQSLPQSHVANARREVGTEYESSALGRQMIDTEASRTPASSAARTTVLDSRLSTTMMEEDSQQLLLIQPGGSVDVLIPYKRAHDLFISLLTADCVQWSRARRRFELNAQGRALDLAQTRVGASELRYGSATGLLVRDALVVLSCADEQGVGAGEWDGEELTSESHTIAPQWHVPQSPQHRSGADNEPPHHGEQEQPRVETDAEGNAPPTMSASAASHHTERPNSSSPQTAATAETFAAQIAAGMYPSHGANNNNNTNTEAGGLLLVRIHAKRAIRNETGIPITVCICEDVDSEDRDDSNGEGDVLQRRRSSTAPQTEDDADWRVGARHYMTTGSASARAAAEAAAAMPSVLVAPGQQLPLSTRCGRVVLRVVMESGHSHRRITYETTLNTQHGQSGRFVQLHPVEDVAHGPPLPQGQPRDSPVSSAPPTSTSAFATAGCRDDQGLDMRPLTFFVVTRRLAESLSNFIYLYPRATLVNHIGVPINVGLWQPDVRAGPQSATDAALLEPWLPQEARESHSMNEKQRAYRRLITLAAHRHVPHRSAMPLLQCDFREGLYMALSFSQCTGDAIRTEDVVEVITSLEDAVEHHPRLLPLRDGNGRTFYIQVAVLHRTIILSAALWVYNFTEYPLLMTDSIVTRKLCAGQNRDTGIIPSRGVPFLLGVRLQDFTQVFIKVGLDARWSGGVAMDVGSKGVFESVQSTIGFTRSCNYSVRLPNAREGHPMTFIITPRWIILNRTNKKLRLWFECPGLTKAIKTSSRLRDQLEKRQAERAAAAAASTASTTATITAATQHDAVAAAEEAWKATFGALSSATSVLLAPGEHHVSCIGTIAGNTVSLREELAGMVPTVTSITDHAVQHKDLSKFYECQRTDPVVIDNPGQTTFNLWAAPRPYLKRQAVVYGGELTVYRPPTTFSASAIEAYDPFLADAVVTGRVAVSVQNANNVLAVVVQPVRATQIRIQNRCLGNTIMVRQRGSRRRNVVQPCRNQFFMWEDSKGERVLRLHMIGYKGKWFEVDFSKGDCHVTRCTTLCQGNQSEYYSPSLEADDRSCIHASGKDSDTALIGDSNARGQVCFNGVRGHLPFHVHGFTSANQSGATILVTDAHVPLLNAGDLWRTSRMQTLLISYMSVAWVMEGLLAATPATRRTTGKTSVARTPQNSRTSRQVSAVSELVNASATAAAAAVAAASSAVVSRGVVLQTVILEGIQLDWLSTDDVNSVYMAVHQVQIVDDVAGKVFFYRARLALPSSAAAATTTTTTTERGHRHGTSGPHPILVPISESSGEDNAPEPETSTREERANVPPMSPAHSVLHHHHPWHPPQAAPSLGRDGMLTAARHAVPTTSRVGSPLGAASVAGSSVLPGRSSPLHRHTQPAATSSTQWTRFRPPTAATWTAATQHVADAARHAVGSAWSLIKGSAVDDAMALGEQHDVEMRVQLTQYADGMVRITSLEASLTPFVLVLSDTWVAQVLQEARRTQATLLPAANFVRRSMRPPSAVTDASGAVTTQNHNNNNNSSFHGVVTLASGTRSGLLAAPTNASITSVGSPLLSPSTTATANALGFPTSPTATTAPRSSQTELPDSDFIAQTEFVRRVVDELIHGGVGVAALAAAVAAGGGLAPVPVVSQEKGQHGRQRKRLRTRFATAVQTQKGVRSTGASGGGDAGAEDEFDGGTTGAGRGGGEANMGTVQTYFRVESMTLSQVSFFITLNRHHPDPLRPLLGVYTLMLPSSLHQRAFHLTPFSLTNTVETTVSLRARLAQWAVHSLRTQWTKATKIGALIDMFAWGRRNLPLKRPPQALTLTRAQYFRSRQMQTGGDFPFLSGSSSSSSASSRSSSSSSLATVTDPSHGAKQTADRDASDYRDKLRRLAQQQRRTRTARASSSGVVIVDAGDDDDDEQEDEEAENQKKNTAGRVVFRRDEDEFY